MLREISTETVTVVDSVICLQNANFHDCYKPPVQLISANNLLSLTQTPKVAFIGDFNDRYVLFEDRTFNNSEYNFINTQT